jgi:hypothetical protein
MNVWSEWEHPWTRAGGLTAGYEPLTELPKPGQVVALRQCSCPYLPTFAPWWSGLIVESADTENVSFSNSGLVASFGNYPLTTHWAIHPPKTA